MDAHSAGSAEKEIIINQREGHGRSLCDDENPRAQDPGMAAKGRSLQAAPDEVQAGESGPPGHRYAELLPEPRIAALYLQRSGRSPRGAEAGPGLPPRRPPGRLHPPRPSPGGPRRRDNGMEVGGDVPGRDAGER